MLNYETILSSYDDKLTLMQWLKKVEDALNNASAVTFNVNKRGDATLTFSIVFEDGSEIESDPLTLQQGESVESAAIVGGHLMLTLTNGDVLDAGNLFNGDVNVTGNVTATGTISAPAIEATGTGIKTDVIQQETSGGIDVYADLVHLNNGLEAQGEIESLNGVRTPVITADEVEIAAQKPIVEVMTGYSYDEVPAAIAGNVENVYIGVAKNGNKVTFVYAFNYTNNNNEAVTNQQLIRFNVPSSLYDKLYPTTIGLYDAVSVGEAIATSDATNISKIPVMVSKLTGNRLQLYAMGSSLNSLTLNTKYYIRFEVTFLLSENMAA